MRTFEVTRHYSGTKTTIVAAASPEEAVARAEDLWDSESDWEVTTSEVKAHSKVTIKELPAQEKA